MRSSVLFAFSVLSAAQPLVVLSSPINSDLYKRFDNARITFFNPGLGACGITSTASDFIVALDALQFDSGENCFKEIAITANGKTVNGQIVDRCPGCPLNGLDLSPALFSQFADLSTGALTGSWVFV